MNIYSDLAQSALKYLKNTQVVINNVLIMIGDFNIHDNFWDPNYSYHSTHSDLLIDIVDSMYLSLLFSLNHVSTRYSDNNCNSNLVINLMFLRYESEELNNYSIYPEWRLVSDHASFTICIPIYLMNIFRPRSIHLSKTAIKKRDSSMNLLIISVKSIHPTYLTVIRQESADRLQ